MDITKGPPPNIGDLDKAEKLYQQALALQEDSSVFLKDSKAIPLLKQAADLGHQEAQFRLGLRYYNEFSTILALLEPSLRAPFELEKGDSQIKSYNWFKKAADTGHTKALFYLSECLREGIGVKADLDKSLECLTEAAERGYSAAQLKLAEHHLKGELLPKDSTSAINWFLKAADQGSTDACLALAVLFHEGSEVGKNYEEAASWWSKAAHLGNSLAMKSLGLSYQRGEGVPQSFEKGVEWFQEAIKCANPDPQAFFLLGLSYLSGKGVDKNNSQAFKYITESAERGYPLGLYALGELYQNGIGTQSNPKMAHKIMNFATYAGDETIVDAVNDFIKREHLE
ncbi:MAG: hypothetical protein LBE27_06905 [Deltaproteobacteria bacterium]|jgi:TPR repeat protein|nr:hypothetical protein [Deltaproteobacteria bacterium]